MKSLIIRTPETVSNPDEFKKVGFTNIPYTANLGAVDATKPPIIRFRFTGGATVNVEVNGATLYKVNNTTGVVDFTTPYDGSLTLTDATGVAAAFAFVPTKSKGQIRITNTGNTLVQFQMPATANTAVEIQFEPSELKNIQSYFINELGLAAGYVNTRLKLVGDVNGFSASDRLTQISIVSALAESSFRNAVWDKKLPATFKIISMSAPRIKADIDLNVFPSNMTLFDLRANTGVSLFGDVYNVLSTKGNVMIKDNFSQDKITGSLNGLSPDVKRVDVVLPNIGAGYTSRTYTYKIEAVVISAPKVPATDFDLLLSDLANSPAVTGTPIRISSRTAASDASVAALVAKGCTVVIA